MDSALGWMPVVILMENKNYINQINYDYEKHTYHGIIMQSQQKGINNDEVQ